MRKKEQGRKCIFMEGQNRGQYRIFKHVCNWNPGNKRDKGAEEIFGKLMAESIPNVVIDTKPQNEKAKKTPTRINIKTKQNT